MGEYPDKDSYKLSEVCQYTDTQPYVLRFWESEFPQLAGGGGAGARSYSKEDIDLVQRIKQLLYEEEYTLAGARKKLEDEASGGRRKRGKGKGKSQAASAKAKARSASKPAPRKQEPQEEPPEPERVEVPQTPRLPLDDRESRDVATVPRQRYEDAVDEIEHLRLKLKEAESNLRKSDSAYEELRDQADRDRRRAEKAVERMERLLEMLS